MDSNEPCIIGLLFSVALKCIIHIHSVHFQIPRSGSQQVKGTHSTPRLFLGPSLGPEAFTGPHFQTQIQGTDCCRSKEIAHRCAEMCRGRLQGPSRRPEAHAVAQHGCKAGACPNTAPRQKKGPHRRAHQHSSIYCSINFSQ